MTTTYGTATVRGEDGQTLFKPTIEITGQTPVVVDAFFATPEDAVKAAQETHLALSA